MMDVITEKTVQAALQKQIDPEAQTPESLTSTPKPEEVVDDNLVHKCLQQTVIY